MNARPALGLLAAALVAGGGLAWRWAERGEGFGEDGLTPLAFTCGDGTCDGAIGETEATCVRDCADPTRRPVGFYADVSSCPEPAEIVFAERVEDVQAAVRAAAAAGRRVKAMGTGHSIAGNYCSDGTVVVLERMRALSPVEDWRGLQTVVIEPGVRFEALGEHLHRAGRSFGPRSTGWGGIGVLGATVTGSHGTSTREASSIHELVVELEVVDPRGERVVYNRFDTDPEVWRALTVSAGALGVLVRARLETYPDRRLDYRVRTHTFAELTTVEGLARAIDGCDYSFLMLFPRSDRVAHGCGAPTEAPVTDEHLTNYLFSPDVPPLQRRLAKGMFQLAAAWSPAEWVLERVSSDRFQHESVGIEGPTDPTYVGAAGVGWNHRIVNLPRFAYEVPYFSQIDYEVSVRVADLPAILAEIDRVFDRAGRSLPLTGVIVRFDRATDTSLLGANAVREGVEPGEMLAHIELPTYHPVGFTDEALAAYRAPSVEVVQGLLARHPTARPHLGKNDAATFRAFAATGNGGPERARFRAVARTLDPGGMFANDWLRDLALVEGEPALAAP